MKRYDIHADGADMYYEDRTNGDWVKFEDVAALLAAQPAADARADRQGCATCNDKGMIGGHSGQTPESYEEWAEPCPDCSDRQGVALSDDDLITCHECHGNGSIDVTHEPLRDGYTETFGQNCDCCHGNGKIKGDPR